MSGELIFGGRDDDGMVPSSPAAPSVAHQVARANRKIRVGYMARKRCSRMLRKRADAPWEVGEREQAPGKTRMVFLEVLSARSDGGDASERASEKSKLGAAPILRSAFSSALHSSHVRRTANCSFSGSSRKTAR